MMNNFRRWRINRLSVRSKGEEIYYVQSDKSVRRFMLLCWIQVILYFAAVDFQNFKVFGASFGNLDANLVHGVIGSFILFILLDVISSELISPKSWGIDTYGILRRYVVAFAWRDNDFWRELPSDEHRRLARVVMRRRRNKLYRVFFRLIVLVLSPLILIAGTGTAISVYSLYKLIVSFGAKIVT